MRVQWLLGLLAGGVLLATAGMAEPAGRVAAASGSSPPSPPSQVRLVITAPAPGSRVESRMNMAELRVSASAQGEGPSRFDVMIVLDVSESTRQASGVDVDGDGQIGEDPKLGLYAPGEFPEDVRSTDPGDTILRAEVKAAETLLEGLDSRRVRVGLITFSGLVDPATGRQRSRDQQDATLEVPLTSDYGRVRQALAEIAGREPQGATDFAAGIRLATRELAGIGGARSQPRQIGRAHV